MSTHKVYQTENATFLFTLISRQYIITIPTFTDEQKGNMMTATTEQLVKSANYMLDSFQLRFEKEAIAEFLTPKFKNNPTEAQVKTMINFFHKKVAVKCADMDKSTRWDLFNPCTEAKAKALNDFLTSIAKEII